MNPNVIPANFRIPKWYRGQFIFLGESNHPLHVITVEDGHLSTQTLRDGATPRETSWCLDWIAETISRIRFECGRRKPKL